MLFMQIKQNPTETDIYRNITLKSEFSWEISLYCVFFDQHVLSLSRKY